LSSLKVYISNFATRCGHKQKFRIGKTTLTGILEDYKKVEEDKSYVEA
jgi:hypothetical protein